MSILIEPTEPSEGQNNSTLTSDPNGPEQFWAGLRLPCPVWKTKDLGTTGGGTVFTVGEEYVTGYLVPKLNGVAQDPTRFSETDKTMGTFTFDVAPDSEWGITADYGIYCDEDLGLHIPTKQGSGLPKKTTGTIGQGNGNGIRVLVAGISGGAPRFGWTENILVSSPAWTANNTGLPGTASTVNLLRLDPFAPSTTAFLRVDGSIYKNTAYRTGGSWSVIFTPAAGTFSGFADVQLSIAQPNFIAILHAHSVNGLTVDHSHDGGTTFPTSAVATVGGSLRRLLVGQWNTNLVACTVTSVPNDFSLSSDHGHSFTGSVEFPNDKFNLFMPYEGNSNQQEIFAASHTTGAIWRSTNGGASFSLYSSPSGFNFLSFSSADSNIVWGVGTDQQASSTTRRISYDKALTFTATTTTDFTIWDGALLRNSIWYFAGDQLLASGKYVQTSTDFTNLTNRTGDLLTSVFTGGTVTVYSIVPDWTT